MKNLITLISLITFISLIVFFPGKTWALEGTNSAIPSVVIQTAGNKDLLDQIATKVAELSAKLQKSYHGQIKSLSSNSFVITTSDGNKTINTNDATSFFRIRAGNRVEINFPALKVGDDMAAIGLIDPVSTDLTARQVIAKIERNNVVGQIQSVDQTTYTVMQSDKSAVKIDLSGAVLKQLDLNGKIIAAKMADFKTGTTVFAIAVSPDETTGVFSVLKAMTLLK